MSSIDNRGTSKDDKVQERNKIQGMDKDVYHYSRLKGLLSLANLHGLYFTLQLICTKFPSK